MTTREGPTGGAQTVLTLGDLMDNPALGLMPATAVDPGARVRGAHSIEIPDAGRWLPPGFVALTTGLRLAAGSPGDVKRTDAADADRSDPVDAAAATALVDDLVHARAAALLFGVGLSFAQVPATIVAAAEHAGLPLLAVPAHVPFWQVEDFVQTSLRSRDAYRLQRTLWLQNDLLEALAHDRPVGAIVTRLGALVGGSATVFEESGRIVASTGAGPARLIWAELRARGLSPSRFAVGRWHVATRTVSVRGVTYAVALSSRREELLDDLGEVLLDTAARLLSAVGGAKALGTTQARADAAQLLAALRGGITPEESLRLWERLRGFRFAPQLPVRAFCALPLGVGHTAPEVRHGKGAASASAATARGLAASSTAHGLATGPHAGGPAAVVSAPSNSAWAPGQGAELGDERWLELHEEAAALGLPLLMRAEPEETPDLPPGSLWGLAADSPALIEWLDALADSHHVGISAAYTSLPATRARLREADRAVAIAVRRARAPFNGRANTAVRDAREGDRDRGRDRGAASGGWRRQRAQVVRFEDLDLATWLLSAQDPAALSAKSAQYLAKLLDNESLRETAVVYLAHHLDVTATAQALFMHPNSVRYRLARIEELLGAPVSSPEVIANLYLAFHDHLAPGR